MTWKMPVNGWVFAAVVAACGHEVFAQPTSATKADSGWVSLFNGTNFDGFYMWSKDAPQLTTNLSTQTVYRVDSGMIRSPSIPNSEYHLVTNKAYSFYKVRVDYRWGPVTGSQNAGLVIHIDSVQAKSGSLPVGTLRPISIEVQMLRTDNNNNSPSTLWSAGSLGPYISSTIQQGSNPPSYLAGGVAWTNDPWGSRTLYTTVANPENAVGQWNRSQAEVYGDSGGFYLNGVLRTRGWRFQVRGSAGDATVANRKRYARGCIGIQQEGNEIWYRNFEIMELDSATRLPINATRGCTNRTATNYNSRAVVDNGSCTGVSAVAAAKLPLKGLASGSVLHLDRADLETLLRRASEQGKLVHLNLYTVEGKQILSLVSSLSSDENRAALLNFKPGRYVVKWNSAR